MNTINSPRNEWAHILEAFEDVRTDHFEALSALEKNAYFYTVDPKAFEIFKRHVEGKAERNPQTIQKLNLPSDFTRNRGGILRRPFRRLMPWSAPPSPYPFDLELPALAAARNDYHSFFQAAPRLIDAAGGAQTQKIAVFYIARDISAAEDVLTSLEAQKGLADLDIVVLMPEPIRGLKTKVKTWCPKARLLPESPLSDTVSQLINQAMHQADGVAFLDGTIRMDARTFDRAAYLLQVSDRIVQGLWPTTEGTTAYAVDRARAFARRYPFRELNGLNMIVPSALLQRTGGLEQRFKSTSHAARELGWRCFNLGAWFAPLLVDHVRPDDSTGSSDGMLFKQLCPNHWDRPKDGRYQVPKVSVYIPAYNSAKYIERAIDSVLDQDVQDLEVCIAIDGSPDTTEEVLARRYGDNSRVHFKNDANGGIGHASNRAIHMSRGMYIGQLDSDDCLKPGAVRRLMEYLDENPQVACCYGSCERIDADGNYLQHEYSWPEFSRRKMMVTSIAHHFRMFRRAAWERTTKFRHDIVNAVDYDIFLKLAETGEFHHIDEILYQRRWHGENTSNVNESYQTSNTYRVQRETLKRLALDNVWDVHIPQADKPRRVTYRRDPSIPRVFFWPNYSQANPYQQLLYQQITGECEIVAGPIETARRVLEERPSAGPVIFHLHWTNFLFRDAEDNLAAQAMAADFLDTLRAFKTLGGKVIWTVHNRISHDARFPELEKFLIQSIMESADILHVHSAASVPELAETFNVPRDRIRVAPHGNYIGVYPDHIDRDSARAHLGLAASDEVIVHTGQVRPYKGIRKLISAFRTLLPNRPNLRLVIAGEQQGNIFEDLPPLSEFEKSRIMNVNRFLDENEFQLFYRAADLAVFPYKSILTSGSLLLALSFGVPAVIPSVGMTREILGDNKGGVAYDPSDPEALAKGMVTVLDQGAPAKAAAFEKAQSIPWTGLRPILHEVVSTMGVELLQQQKILAGKGL